MSVHHARITAAVLRSSAWARASRTAQRIYLELALNAGSDRETTRRRDELVEAMGIHPDNVRKGIRELVRLGLVETGEPSPGRGNACSWFKLPNEPENPAQRAGNSDAKPSATHPPNPAHCAGETQRTAPTNPAQRAHPSYMETRGNTREKD